ncbi:MAG TPA: metallophosphoesterase [Pirellulaceae bacterium]|jgi:preprotein translocase subunit Sec61beta|nr:metallophosphoesterase [Pirellulaceae bacterium]
MGQLVAALPEGPLDIVGDVHGELEPLEDLRRRLGYREDGSHPEGRRLIFVGDLVDRGPDSPGVVRLVRGWIEAGHALAVVGNHEFNLLRRLDRQGNAWFYGREEANDGRGPVDPQVLADEAFRQEFDRFASQLPLALVGEQLIVVHASPHEASLARAEKSASGLLEFYDEENARAKKIASRWPEGAVEWGVAMQNENAVRTIVSGPEEPSARVYASAGKMRNKQRVRWWDRELPSVPVVFGHYWRIPEPTDAPELHVFEEDDPFAFNVPGRAICIDYSVGKRWLERREGKGSGFRSQLAALRWPEWRLVTDEGHEIDLQQALTPDRISAEA